MAMRWKLITCTAKKTWTTVLCESLKHNTEGLRQAVLYYDIMCQYWVNMRRRFAANPLLSFLEDLKKIS